MDFETLPEPRVLLADDIKSIRSVLGSETTEADVLRALEAAGNNLDRAINILLDARWTSFECKPQEGVNIWFESRSFEDECAPQVSDCASMALTAESAAHKPLQFKSKPLSKDAVFQPCRTATSCLDYINAGVKKDDIDVKPAAKNEVLVTGSYKGPILGPPDFKIKNKAGMCLEENRVVVDKEENLHIDLDRADNLKEMNEDFEESSDNFSMLATAHYSPHLNHRPIRALSPKPVTESTKLGVFSKPELAELAEFQEEPDWFLVGRSYVMALSTTRGWGKLEPNEIVYFNFPKVCGAKSYGKLRFSLKAAAATSEIVRFSTKRSGEIGRLPPEWSRCLIPLVQSSKVKVRGRCALTPFELALMTEMTLYISFYIHGSVFTKLVTTWKLESPPQLSPLHSLFCLLKIKPLKEAEFTPGELKSRKRSLSLGDKDNESEHIQSLAKRRKGVTTYIEQSNDEQATSEAALNKLVGTSVPYNLQEAKPPSTLVSNLWPYQKQAIHWMTTIEKGIDVEEVAKALHPCWSAYNICDKRAPTVYVNVFTGEATTKFPCATQMARGGILADAMGLGKTVMTIALILANPSKGKLDEEDAQKQSWNESERGLGRGSSRLDGGTLIVCPMALLGQWKSSEERFPCIIGTSIKIQSTLFLTLSVIERTSIKDELEAHSLSGSLSIFVHYGGDKSNDPAEISKYDVVLTSYGVLTSAYKTVREGSNKKSIFHTIRWYRVVLDEAHTIKCPKTIVAQSTFALISYCKWCLTSTPIQNSLEDLYSLLCFLNVQPWSNWSWWYKLIQRPYENGKERGLRLVKAILRPLMLRRTKETTDKEGKPIIILPPIHFDVVLCQQSEEERNFYDALFWKSKIKFDQFVAQGKVLNNYASILELLLRLRQCCNHPYLVMSDGDNQMCADLNDLARRFLECCQNNPCGSSQCAAPAYVEEVVEGIKRGEVSECPICLESASDDPVFTPCAHRMCRECLLASWKTPTSGTCPVCRRALTKADLITCPIDRRLQMNMNKNWKESAKIRELITCLKKIRRSCSGEKSIVFSQWTSFLDLLEICFRKEGIQFLRFDGKLSHKAREMVLKEFSESLNNEVLLMSLKAGGVGLNLTVASNVFLMDPWWNPAVEEQAIMRIHRIGQKRQVQVRRFIAKDTVEERMQQVQARKQRSMAGALTDEEVRTARIEELKMLFR